MNLEEFIKTQIESVDELRVLLLLRARAPDGLDREEIACKLYLQIPVATEALDKLARKGLLESAGDPRHYRLQPRSSELVDLIEQLAELDRNRPVTLINMIYERRSNLEAFSNAFKLKKDKEN